MPARRPRSWPPPVWGPQLCPLADVEQADPFRAVKLVRGQRQQVHVQHLHVQRKIAAGLHRVGVEGNAVLSGDGADLGDRFDRAHLVVGVHHADQRGVRSNRRGYGRRLHQASAVHRQDRHLEVEVPGQVGRGVQHSVVLDGRGDDVPAPAGRLRQPDAAQRQVVALGAAPGEHDLGRPAIQHRRDPRPSILQRRGRAAAQPIDAGWVAVGFCPKRRHRIDHARINGRGRRVVKIDHQNLTSNLLLVDW